MSASKSSTEILHDIQASLQGVTTTLHHIERRFQKVEAEQEQIRARFAESGKTDWKLFIAFISAGITCLAWIFQVQLSPMQDKLETFQTHVRDQSSLAVEMAKTAEREIQMRRDLDELRSCVKLYQ